MTEGRSGNALLQLALGLFARSLQSAIAGAEIRRVGEVRAQRGKHERWIFRPSGRSDLCFANATIPVVFKEAFQRISRVARGKTGHGEIREIRRTDSFDDVGLGEGELRDLSQREAGARAGHVLQSGQQLTVEARALVSRDRVQQAIQHEHGGQEVGVGGQHDRAGLVQEVLYVA